MAKKNHPEARIFYPDTRFERLARRPTEVTREQALASAHSEVDELKPDFTVWLNLELEELTATFARIDGDRDHPSLDQAHRSCVQLRDVGATMGFALVTFVAENLCQIIDAIKAGAPYDAEVINCHVDALFLARTDAYRDASPDQLPEMANGLRRVVEIVSIIPDRKTK